MLFGESDVLKTIQLLPGVSNAGEGTGGFNVRGGAADQNLILFDEAIIYSSSHLFGLFSIFNSDAIKEVKLYKGGIPSSYGGRLSSVLDVYQKDGNSKEHKLSGGIGVISSRLLGEGPIKKNKGSYEDLPQVKHPLVQTHPVTKKKSLFLSPHTMVNIDGFNEKVKLRPSGPLID